MTTAAFVLIMFFSRESMVSADFNTEAACRAAALDMIAKYQSLYINLGRAASVWGCYPKGVE